MKSTQDLTFSKPDPAFPCIQEISKTKIGSLLQGILIVDNNSQESDIKLGLIHMRRLRGRWGAAAKNTREAWMCQPGWRHTPYEAKRKVIQALRYCSSCDKSVWFMKTSSLTFLTFQRHRRQKRKAPKLSSEDRRCPPSLSSPSGWKS